MKREFPSASLAAAATAAITQRPPASGRSGPHIDGHGQRGPRRGSGLGPRGRAAP